VSYSDFHQNLLIAMLNFMLRTRGIDRWLFSRG
jgi:hypothetical protein